MNCVAPSRIMQSRAMPVRQLPAHVVTMAQPCMLLDEDAIIMIDLEESLRGIGLSNIRIATTLLRASQISAATMPRLAILDYKIHGGTSLKVAEEMAAGGAQIIFLTGYGDALLLPPILDGAKVISKPFVIGDLIAALRELFPLNK